MKNKVLAAIVTGSLFFAPSLCVADKIDDDINEAIKNLPRDQAIYEAKQQAERDKIAAEVKRAEEDLAKQQIKVDKAHESFLSQAQKIAKEQSVSMSKELDKSVAGTNGLKFRQNLLQRFYFKSTTEPDRNAIKPQLDSMNSLMTLQVAQNARLIEQNDEIITLLRKLAAK